MTTKTNQEAQRRNPIDRAMGGWQPARVLMAANHLNFFTVIGDDTLTAEEIAACCTTHPRSTLMLLNACVAINILEKEGPYYRNSPEAKESLVRGKPTYIGDGIAHSDDMWENWGKLHEAVRTNSRAAVYRDITDEPEKHRNFILAMHNGAMRTAPLLVETLDLTGRHQLFDAGGGPGTYSLFLVKRYSGLRAIVFDLPETIEIAKEIIAQFGVGDLVTTRAGDYFKNNFGQGNDVVLLSSILHSMGPEKSKGLLRKAYDSLISGGIVVVHEGLIDEDGTSPLRAVLFSLNMLIHTSEGQSYSGSEIIGLMEAVDFVQPRIIPLPEPARTSLVISVKP